MIFSKKGMTSSFAVLLAAVTVAGALADARSQQAVTEKAEVAVISVPVVVTGNDGRPVKDLKKGDFRIKDNGNPQEIEDMLLVEIPLPVAQAAPPPAPGGIRLARHFIFLFDLSFGDLGGLRAAREATLKFIDGDMVPGDDAAIFTIDLTAGVRMHMNFTQDKEQLADAVASLASTRGNKFLADSAGLVRIVPVERTGPVKATWLRKGLTQGPRDMRAEEDDYLYRDLKRSDVQQYRTDVGRYLDRLSTFARSIDAMPGRKVMVLFSHGFDIKALGGETLDEATLNAEKFALGEFTKMDTSTRDVDNRNINTLEKAANNFSTSDCRIFSIDPTGGRQIGEATTTEDSAVRTHVMLEQLAGETGGQVFRHTNLIDRVMTTVAESTTSYYLLTYRAPSTKTGKYHEIDVDLERSGTKISYRKGYYEDKPFVEYNDLERQLQVASILNSARSPVGIDVPAYGFSFPGCTVTAESAESAEAGGLPQIVGVVEMPEEVLTSMGVTKEREFEFFLFATNDSTGDVIGYSHHQARASVAGPSELPAGTARGGLRYLGVMSVPPGVYRLLGIARDLETGKCAVGSSRVSLLPFIGLSVSSCLLSEGGEWTNVLAKNQASCFPLTFEGKQVAARAKPELRAGDECLMLVKLYGLEKQDKPDAPPLDLALRVTGSDGSPTPVSAHKFLRGEWLSTSDYEMLLRIKLPTQLGPGRYQLEVEASARGGARKSSARIPFEVG
ncbi:MAG: VWA domain-containing protein [Acidobacteriota bacterium]